MGKGYLMDTNAVIGFLGGNIPGNAKTKLSAVVPAISVITSIELFSSNNTPRKEIAQLNAFVKAAVIYNFIDQAIVAQAIHIRKAYKTKTPDAIIAATAMVNGLTLITRNVKDFRLIENLEVINPWEM